MTPRLKNVLKILGVLGSLYVFFVSIQLMGDSFKTWKAFSEALIREAQNPFVGLFIGILATSIIQSSSTTTSMTVGFVASGVLDVSLAVPIIMGANVGTSVTNTLVSVGHISRRAEFRRAMACATVHDMFNILAVLVLLPVELLTRALFKVGMLEEGAHLLADLFAGVGGFTLTSPLKTITKPVTHFLKDTVLESVFAPGTAVAVMGLVLSAVLLIIALSSIVKLMRSMVLERIEVFFDRYVGVHGAVAITLGLVITVMVQSSSITTSMLVPMAGAGILRLSQAFPITLGANIGTTVTAILASLAATGEEAQLAAVTIAFVHLLFNLAGILIFYPLPQMRRIPLFLATSLAAACTARRWFAPVYILAVFFVLPALLVLVWHALF